jgi:hypothetical protein
VSKYRVEFKSSRLQLVFQLLTYLVFVLSVFSWQPDIIKYQLLLQILVGYCITFLVFKSVLHSRRQAQVPVIFSVRGEWVESSVDGQTSWTITAKSRVSNLLLFVQLISPVNTRHSKWCLIYKDQVTERDFRRLCRAIIYQQQTAAKD